MKCLDCDRTKCFKCDGTGEVKRFIIEHKEDERDLEKYLSTEPHKDYYLASVMRPKMGYSFDLIWERK